MSDIAIKVEGLHKRYRLGSVHGGEGISGLLSRGVQGFFRRKTRKCQKQSIWALRDVSFDIHRGEVFGVI